MVKAGALVQGTLRGEIDKQHSRQSNIVYLFKNVKHETYDTSVNDKNHQLYQNKMGIY